MGSYKGIQKLPHKRDKARLVTLLFYLFSRFHATVTVQQVAQRDYSSLYDRMV